MPEAFLTLTIINDRRIPRIVIRASLLRTCKAAPRMADEVSEMPHVLIV